MVTRPVPITHWNGRPLSYEESKTVPSSSVPTYWVVISAPLTQVLPSPTTMSSICSSLLIAVSSTGGSARRLPGGLFRRNCAAWQPSARLPLEMQQRRAGDLRHCQQAARTGNGADGERLS
ncbi:hypothetical protein D3C72_1970760 [compost metagenome]